MYFFDPMDFAFPKGSATGSLQVFVRDSWYSHYYLNDFIFVNNPDGTLGMYYDVNNFTGTTDTVQNFSSQITEQYCNILSSKFDELRKDIITSFYDGLSQLPECQRTLWDVTCASEKFATYFQTYTYRTIPNCYWDKRRNVCATLPNPIDDATCCGDDFKIDFNELTSISLSATTTKEQFENIINTELIDVKTRKTLNGYPTLKALYERYMASYGYTNNNSLMYDYTKIDELSNMVGKHWVELIEQVIPATTIWGSVKIYSNTSFDQQKFTYKRGTMFTCIEEITSDMLSYKTDVGVDTTKIENTLSKPTTNKCTGVYMKNYDYSSEFIGTITVVDNNPQVEVNPENLLNDGNIIVSKY